MEQVRQESPIVDLDQNISLFEIIVENQPAVDEVIINESLLMSLPVSEIVSN